MPQSCTIRLRPQEMDQGDLAKRRVARALGVAPGRIQHLKLLRRSIDARKKPWIVLRYSAWIDEPYQETPVSAFPLQPVEQGRSALIVGMGPAGLFAALHLIRLGIKPIILERGKAVRPRRRDLAVLNREGKVNPESNYCFGEGGAGTFSDGKLYTRSTKRGDIQEVLRTLVQFGATEEILIDAHPHIGTNKLPQIIQHMRDQIIACGGEVHFETKVSELWQEGGKLKGVITAAGDRISGEALILATGHSARDVFQMLDQQGLSLEFKSFALGVRVEHPQPLIDQIQYRLAGKRPPALPAASYSLVRQVRNTGVYSFCMCPGGIICPATTAPDELVVNGWSPSLRNTGFANSGIVVEVNRWNLPKKLSGPLAGIAFQAFVEQKAFRIGGGQQVAPAQRMTDFLTGKLSPNLPECSYLPGLQAAELRGILPKFVHRSLQEALRYFGKQLDGYLSEEAVVVGVESRTSSPVRIPRDPQHLMHPQLMGLFPCGEGAGYAGGIMSAALDGKRCAEALARYLKQPISSGPESKAT